MTAQLPRQKHIRRLVKQCLREDVGDGDLTAALTPKKKVITGRIITREEGVMCGSAWVEAVFDQVASRKHPVDIHWHAEDGQALTAGQTICEIKGRARTVLTAERSALNLLQTLSGTATRTRAYAELIAHTKARLLDTRKTLPGLRLAQKYAVVCGGGHNHRIGLYDGIIIKENHIRSADSLETLVKKAQASVNEGTLVELEVETLDELRRGLAAGTKRIMLDDFSLADLKAAVEINQGQAKLEASGGVSLETIKAIAETGVDYISCGSITKHMTALDLSMQFDR